MDLHIVGAEPTEAERAAVDEVLGLPSSGWYGGERDIERDGRASHGGRRAWADRDLLLPAFHGVQDRIGWISRGALNYICRRLSVPPAEAWGVVTFYHLLATEPRAPIVAHVCHDIACRLRGAERICAELAGALGGSEDPPLQELSATYGSPAQSVQHLSSGGGSSMPPVQHLSGGGGSSSPLVQHLSGGGGSSTPPGQHLSGGGGSLTPPAQHLSRRGGSSDPPEIAWQRSPCLGQCDRAPAALIIAAGATPIRRECTGLTSGHDLIRAIDGLAEAQGLAEAPFDSAQGRKASALRTTGQTTRRAAPILRMEGQDFRALSKVEGSPGQSASAGSFRKILRRVGRVDPTSLEDYRAHGGYTALTRAVALDRDGVIAEVTASGLLGRGGAAFPTGRKWDAVAREQATPHYVVCNADESEPGTFKDRVLMCDDPFAIVEAMTICAFATGAEHGFVYVRGEYPLAEERMEQAIAQARDADLLGDIVIGGFRFDIEVRRGAGAYICGEETALFNSIEGRRGEPRSKPPFPAQFGLFGKPTVVNNVETLVNVLDVVLEGGAAWARIGTKASTGTRLFCLSGHVTQPGLYEVPFGVTLGELVTLAGGVANGRALKGILLGGAAGVFVGLESLDLKLTFEDVRAAGATLGSGVVMVFDDTTDFGDILTRIAEFFQHESCGQCVPCRIGTVRQREILERLRAADSPNGELVLLTELGQAMRDASICGLGQTASSAIESAIARLHVYGPAEGGPYV